MLVPFVLPGEVVRVEIQKRRPGLLEARLAGVVTHSANRVAPLCPYFTRCGGCHYQHAAYGFQLAQKSAVLRDTVRRIGKLELPEEIAIFSASPWEYRNRAQYHIVGGRIGYREAGSSRLCAVDHCPISSPAINAALAALNEMSHDNRFPRFLRSLELFTNEQSVLMNVLESGHPVGRGFLEWCEERISGASSDSLKYSAVGRLYRVSHNSFFQVNRFLIDQLVQVALQDARGEEAVDLYAGVGLFSLHLAERFGTVQAVESGASAVRDLELNAGNTSSNVKAQRTTVEVFLRGLQRKPDFVLADPPRAGLGVAVVRELLRLRPPRLVIVACDPATLARDLTALVAGGYGIDHVEIIDLFPQTFHIETVASLQLR